MNKIFLGEVVLWIAILAFVALVGVIIYNYDPCEPEVYCEVSE